MFLSEDLSARICARQSDISSFFRNFLSQVTLHTYLLDSLSTRGESRDAFRQYCRKLVSSYCIRSLFRIYVPVTQYGVVTSTVAQRTL